MTKDEFRNEYIKIDNQLRLLKSKYVQEFIEKWGIVFDKPMKIITNHGFTQSEWKGYIRWIDVNYSGYISIKLSEMKKNGKAKNSVVSIDYYTKYVNFEKLKDK